MKEQHCAIFVANTGYNYHVIMGLAIKFGAYTTMKHKDHAIKFAGVYHYKAQGVLSSLSTSASTHNLVPSMIQSSTGASNLGLASILQRVDTVSSTPQWKSFYPSSRSILC